MRLLILALAATVALVGCGGGHPRQVTIAGVDAITAEDKAVLDRRLGADGTFAFLHPATTYAAHDGRLDIVAGAADASADELRFLLSHQGRVAITSEWGRVWLERGDIAGAQARMGENGQQLLTFLLTPTGQQRLAKFTKQADATSAMLIKLDDETLVTARFSRPIDSASVQVDVSRPVAEVILIAQVIHSGALSFKPGAVTVDAAAAR